MYESRLGDPRHPDEYRAGPQLEPGWDGGFPPVLTDPVGADGEIIPGRWLYGMHNDNLRIVRYFHSEVVYPDGEPDQNA